MSAEDFAHAIEIARARDKQGAPAYLVVRPGRRVYVALWLHTAQMLAAAAPGSHIVHYGTGRLAPLE
ncbi:hypothetical protein [Pseudomonas sp.]|uniref:hypothetical protein n=1 Tax=Pseudomonas sp. TaxID=306 RepID=UPI0026051192|nr:hypothetical protein [Pseudomonas sp.]